MDLWLYGSVEASFTLPVYKNYSSSPNYFRTTLILSVVIKIVLLHVINLKMFPENCWANI